MAAGDERDQNLVEHRVLAEDARCDLAPQLDRRFQQLVALRGDPGHCRHRTVNLHTWTESGYRARSESSNAGSGGEKTP